MTSHQEHWFCKWPKQKTDGPVMSNGVQLKTSFVLAITLLLVGIYTQGSHPNQDTGTPPTIDQIFKTVKELGHGSFGKVKLVELILTGERLALKVMEKDQCPKNLRIKELHAFIQIGFSPFIVRFHSCFQTETVCCLLMQYHCGGSLAKIIEEFGTIDEATARFFVAEVVEGLAHLHSRGIIHRDIKLANILLGVDNHVRICDLGLCKLGMTGSARTHTRCGALRYCSPEVLAREWYGKEVDWWSLGIVLFRMLTGQYPFDAETREEIENMVKHGEPNLTLVPPGITQDIIIRFLAKDAKARLGFGPDGPNQIRKDPFFAEINWEQLQARQVKVPLVTKRPFRPSSIRRETQLNLGPDYPSVYEWALYTLIVATLLYLLLDFVFNPQHHHHYRLLGSAVVEQVAEWRRSVGLPVEAGSTKGRER